MADVKDRDKKPDGRTNPYTFTEPRPKAEIVAEAYEIEQPTPTQEECDEAKLAALGQTEPPEPPPEGTGTQNAQPKPGTKTVEAEKPGGYQTRAANPKSE